MFEMMDDVLTIEEAREALKIGRNYIYKILASGELAGYKVGRTWRIPKSALDAYIKGAQLRKESRF